MVRMRARVVLVSFALLCAAGCGSDDGSSDSATPATTLEAPADTGDAGPADGGCDPASAVEPGEYEHRTTWDGVESSYWVVVPDGYDPQVPDDLYLVVPGGSGSAQAALTGWGPSLAGVDAIVAFVDVARADRRTVPAVRALIEDAAARYCIDRTRVYATGTSASAGFTGRLMADASDVIAAFAPGIGMFAPLGLEPIGPVPLIAWSGDPDRSTVERSVAAWAASNGCEPEPAVVDLGSGVTHHHYEGCGAPTEYYYFAGMGHQVPNHDCSGLQFCAEYEEFDFWEDVGRFFEANPLPAP